MKAKQNHRIFYVINNYNGYVINKSLKDTIEKRPNFNYDRLNLIDRINFDYGKDAEEILNNFDAKFKRVFDILNNLRDDEWKFVSFLDGNAVNGIREPHNSHLWAIYASSNYNILNIPSDRVIPNCNPRLEECNFFKRVIGIDKLTFAKIVSSDVEFNEYERSGDEKKLGVAYKENRLATDILKKLYQYIPLK